MKYIFLVFCCIQILMTPACKKDTTTRKDNHVSGPDSLPGSWEYRSYYGGYGIVDHDSAEPGNGRIYKFSGNRYWYYENNLPRDSGTYILTTAINPNTNEEQSAIRFDDTYTHTFSIARDTFTLVRGAVASDGVIEKYVRIANADGK